MLTRMINISSVHTHSRTHARTHTQTQIGRTLQYWPQWKRMQTLSFFVSSPCVSDTHILVRLNCHGERERERERKRERDSFTFYPASFFSLKISFSLSVDHIGINMFFFCSTSLITQSIPYSEDWDCDELWMLKKVFTLSIIFLF